LFPGGLRETKLAVFLGASDLKMLIVNLTFKKLNTLSKSKSSFFRSYRLHYSNLCHITVIKDLPKAGFAVQ